MSSNTFTVAGMTCSHCVMSVTEEVTQVPGVQDIEVDLATGRLTVVSDVEIDPVAIQEAVQEAGYQVTGS